MIDHHRQSGQVIDGDSEGVIQRSRVMNVERDELVRTSGFQQLGDIAGCNRVSQLRAPILARKRQVGEKNNPSAGTSISQSQQQEQQSQEPFADRQVIGPGQ
jgi:hypothetical protein